MVGEGGAASVRLPFDELNITGDHQQQKDNENALRWVCLVGLLVVIRSFTGVLRAFSKSKGDLRITGQRTAKSAKNAKLKVFTLCALRA